MASLDNTGFHAESTWRGSCPAVVGVLRAREAVIGIDCPGLGTLLAMVLSFVMALPTNLKAINELDYETYTAQVRPAS